jgi:restriction endonuclease Mrr
MLEIVALRGQNAVHTLLYLPGFALLGAAGLLYERCHRWQSEQIRAEKREYLSFANPDALQDLNEARFLEFSAKLFTHLGYQTYIISRDKAAEYHLLLFRRQGKFVARCCKYDQGIGQNHLQPLLMALQKNYADKAFFITADTFTKSALDFSARNQIDLIDGSRLITLATQAFKPTGGEMAAGR